MRYEVLSMLYRASRDDPDAVVRAWEFAGELGVWRAEVFRAIEFLDRAGFVSYLGAGPRVRITQSGIELIESGGSYPGIQPP